MSHTVDEAMQSTPVPIAPDVENVPAAVETQPDVIPSPAQANRISLTEDLPQEGEARPNILTEEPESGLEHHDGAELSKEPLAPSTNPEENKREAQDAPAQQSDDVKQDGHIQISTDADKPTKPIEEQKATKPVRSDSTFSTVMSSAKTKATSYLPKGRINKRTTASHHQGTTKHNGGCTIF